MGDLDKLDLILRALDDAAKARERQTEKLDSLALDTRAHFVEDRAFMDRTNRRLDDLEAASKADITQRLRALDEPKETWLSAKRAFLALLIGTPVTIAIALFAAWFMHAFGWK